MRKIVLSVLLSFLFVLFFSECKKHTEQPTQHVNITLYDKPLSVIQSNIQGKWQLQYTQGGIGVGISPLTETVVYNFVQNRISITTNAIVVTDTTINWKWDLGVFTLGDSTFILNYYDKFGYQTNFVVDGIVNDTLLFHDNASDPLYYHFSKLN